MALRSCSGQRLLPTSPPQQMGKKTNKASHFPPKITTISEQNLFVIEVPNAHFWPKLATIFRAVRRKIGLFFICEKSKCAKMAAHCGAVNISSSPNNTEIKTKRRNTELFTHSRVQSTGLFFLSNRRSWKIVISSLSMATEIASGDLAM